MAPKGEQSNPEKLRKEILKLSRAKKWAAAVLEWEHEEIEVRDKSEPERCLCGHKPILNLCKLYNRETGKRAIVGNVCVRKFTGDGAVFEDAIEVADAGEKFTKAVRYATSDASTRKSYDEKTVPQKIVNLLAGEPLIAFAERKGIFTQKGAWDDGS